MPSPPDVTAARRFMYVGLVLLASASWGAAPDWRREWPRTDFTRHAVDLEDITSGGPSKDGIPAIDEPRFGPLGSKALEAEALTANEPVIELVLDGEAKAYPLRILMWHEIVNDVVARVPVAVTYCPLCNAGMVFDRRHEGVTHDFGVSGMLRHSDMLMYDRQTESWWQQFTGTAVVGAMTGRALRRLPARVLPFHVFVASHPTGSVLLPPLDSPRDYGRNPYIGYDDTSSHPMLYRGRYHGAVPPLAYVVAVGDNAWPLATLRAAGTLSRDDWVISWRPGMTSVLDRNSIAHGRDLGYVEVQRRSPTGALETVPHDLVFAFAFMAFNPAGTIHLGDLP